MREWLSSYDEEGNRASAKDDMEVYEMLPDGTLAELIDGIIYMSPSPVAIHQIVQGEITRQLANHELEGI